MNFTETLKLAMSAIWAHKLRSFLTLLGMIIGVTAFMVVLSLLQGFNKYVDEKIAGIGSNSFTIRRFSFDDFKNTDTIAEAQRRNKELTFDELEFIKERAQSIDKIGAKALPNIAELKRGTEIMQDVTIDGAEPIMGDIDNVDVAEGRYFTEAENNNAQRVAFIGVDVANKLFPYGSAIGQEFTMRGIPYRVIGIQTAKGSVFGQPQDVFVQLPIKTYEANFGTLTRSRGLYFVATAKSPKLFNDAVEEAKTLMRIKRKLSLNDKDNFGVLTPDAIASLRDAILGFFISIYVIQTYIPWYAAVISIGVSALVGICAGLFPAWKAARLDPIEALRAD